MQRLAISRAVAARLEEGEHVARREERRLQQGLVLAFLAITVRQVQVILHKLLLVTSLIAEEVWFLRYVSPGHGRH